MSAVFTLFCLGAAVGVAALLDHWRETGRTDDATRYCRTGAHPWQADDPGWDDDTCPWHADVLRAYDEELSP